MSTIGPVVIDLSAVRTASDLHELLARKLAFPDYYGRNWDAFDECFGDPDAGTLPDSVRFLGWEALNQRLPQEAKLLRECVEDARAKGAGHDGGAHGLLGFHRPRSRSGPRRFRNRATTSAGILGASLT